MKFSVVIVNYNGGKHVVDAVASVQLQRCAGIPSNISEIVVVDNGSTDGSLALIEEWIIKVGGSLEPLPPIVVLKMGENLGFAAAFNTGFAKTTGDVILRLDNDAILRFGALEIVERFLEKTTAAMVAPKVMFRGNEHLVNTTGMEVYWDASAIDRDYKRTVYEVDRERGLVIGPAGCVGFIRREVFEKIGLLDPEFFNYFEDVDFALRAARAGFSCVYLPEAVATHIGGGAMALKPSDWKLEMLHRNQARVLVRNFGIFAYVRGLAVFCGRLFTMRLLGDREVYKAHRKAVSFLWKERKALKAQRREIRTLGPDKRVDKWIRAWWL
jgi:GT2 family glycosyltransferase